MFWLDTRVTLALELINRQGAEGPEKLHAPCSSPSNSSRWLRKLDTGDFVISPKQRNFVSLMTNSRLISKCPKYPSGWLMSHGDADPLKSDSNITLRRRLALWLLP